jgi:16S rRNA processing protein RimM
VRIRPFTERPEGIAAYGPVAVPDGRRFAIEIVAVARGEVTARLEGVTDRDAAQALAGSELSVAADLLPQAAPGEYYHRDLLGLRAETRDGRGLGTVAAVHDFGAGGILEIAGPDGRAAMVPFTREVVPEVDIAGGRIVIDPPPGLLEDETPDG